MHSLKRGCCESRDLHQFTSDRINNHIDCGRGCKKTENYQFSAQKCDFLHISCVPYGREPHSFPTSEERVDANPKLVSQQPPLKKYLYKTHSIL